MACVGIFSTAIQVSSQPKELSLDEAMIPWWDHLKFRICNAGKMKYGVHYQIISMMKICIAERQNLKDNSVRQQLRSE
jgi:hypothetical protein